MGNTNETLRKPRIVSIFSGCGGLDYGFHMEGYETIWANDFAEWACKSFAANFGDVIHYKDITKIDPYTDTTIPECDIVLGGFPCQDFSIIWKQPGLNGTRGGLFRHFAEFVDAKKQTTIYLSQDNHMIDSYDRFNEQINFLYCGSINHIIDIDKIVSILKDIMRLKKVHLDIIGDGENNGFKFENTYVQEAGTGTNPSNPTPDPDYTENGSLKISKNVIGNESSDTSFTASTSDEFNFTVNFVFPAGTDKNTLGGVKVDGTDVTINGDGDATLILKHNETKKFTGVPVGTKIIVTEAAKANYKGSAAVVINNEDKVAVVATKFNEEIKVLDEAANTGYKLGQNKNTVDVTNRYNNVPTTGIIMNTLPYVLMVALCAAALFGFVAFKRKKVQK